MVHLQGAPMSGTPGRRGARIAGFVLLAALGTLLLPNPRFVVRSRDTLRPVPPARGSLAPPLDAALLGGGRFSLAESGGQVTALAFFASWCDPCRAELPGLNTLAQRYSGSARIVAVNIEEPGARPRVQALVREL